LIKQTKIGLLESRFVSSKDLLWLYLNRFNVKGDFNLFLVYV